MSDLRALGCHGEHDRAGRKKHYILPPGRSIELAERKTVERVFSGWIASQPVEYALVSQRLSGRDTALCDAECAIVPWCRVLILRAGISRDPLYNSAKCSQDHANGCSSSHQDCSGR